MTCLLCLPLLAAWGQTREIRGTVTDAKSGVPIPDASVLIKGSSVGTMTGANGGFSLMAGSDAVLSVVFMGYQQRDIAVGDRSVVDVVLREDADLLDEVVVVAHGSQKKISITGAVTSVSNDELVSENCTKAITLQNISNFGELNRR